MIKLFSPKNLQYESYIERGKFLMAYRLTFIFTIVFLVMSVIFMKQELFAFIGYFAAFIISLTAIIYLRITKKFQHIFMFYGIIGTLLTQFAINTSHQTPHFVDYLWMIVASFLAFIGLGRKWGLIILSANALFSSYFIFVTHNTHLKILQPFTTEMAIISYSEIVMAFFALGYLMYQFLLFQSYSENKLQKANAELNRQNSLILAKNNENSTLVKEIHHRVKNNLQIIISLLRLQQSEIVNEEARSNFTEAINRVMVMSSIHQRLYQEKEVSRINLKSYLSDLAEDLKMIFQTEKKIDVQISSTYGEIDLKTLVPLGLLLNELISNSYKYAFNAVSEGVIKIDITEQKDKFDLIYFDNGTWREQESNRASFGLDLINILAEQLNGSFAFTTNETGTRYHFSLSKLV